ncbi:hypothetical protein RRG08_055233 [Elysia crispata]|uniref:Uncharacterized protein n=1 Tax=Elysia crispata TaxID=231223 RepID=A0AAE0XV28_9GAST|nr:hypothetical protein RRG08_055233 [Elysia crispata]
MKGPETLELRHPLSPAILLDLPASADDARARQQKNQALSAMDVSKTLLLVCLLTISLIAQWSLASPVVQGMDTHLVFSEGESSSLDHPFRLRRSAEIVNVADPAQLSSHQAADTGFLLRLRRSLAQMYAGSIHYNSHRHGGRRRHRRMRHRHRHHRRQRGGRVVDA